MSDEAKDQEKAVEVFREVTTTLEEAGFDFAVGGGLATGHWTGGAKRIADIDLVIRRRGATQILSHLENTAGFETGEMQHSWLHKAFKDGVTVDLMFELKNGVTFDDGFAAHRKPGEMFGTTVLVMSPEDQVASLAGTVDRQTIGQHWYSMIDIMANHDLEWDYLIARSQEVPLQMLSVIYFALADDVPVQKGVIEQLQELASKHP